MVDPGVEAFLGECREVTRVGECMAVNVQGWIQEFMRAWVRECREVRLLVSDTEPGVEEGPDPCGNGPERN